MSRYDRNRSNKSTKTTFLIIAILLALPIGMGGSYYFMDDIRRATEIGATIPEETPANKTAVTEGYPDEQQAPADEQLEFLHTEPKTIAGNDGQTSTQQSGSPDLLTSDDFVQQSLVKIAPGLAQWLNTDQLIRKYVLITNDFAQGLRITKHISFLRIEEPFSVEQDKNESFIASKSFQRYDKLAQTIQVIDAKAAVAVYQKLRPLMLQVFAEFSYPQDITLEEIVKKAMAEILATPAIDEQIALVRPSVHYKFADAKLEALSPVQKQMIRMGPTNTRIIQGKCREFLVALAQSGIQ
jgi:Protein of unknown function (DUF3014)